jgi:hypothetical protein
MKPWQPRDIVDQLPRSQTESYKERPLSGVKYIVGHHVGVDADPTPEQTALYHVNEHGWPGCGYHAIVLKDGSGYLTQRLTTMSYHVAGQNHLAVGILINGDFRQGRLPTKAQMVTVPKFIGWIQAQLPVHAAIVGHGDIALPGQETSCPGDTWPQWKGQLL